MAKQFFFEGKTRSREELLKIFEQDRKINRLNIVHDMIAGKSNKLLDIGCGAGYTSDFYSDKIGEFMGTDIIKGNIDIAKEFFSAPNRKFVAEDIFKPKTIPQNHFDYVLMLETIEHVDNPFDFIKQSTKFLKKGGHVIISTPHAVSLTNILWNLKMRNHRVKGYDFNGTQTDHLYTWDRQVLQNLLVKIGLQIEEVRLSRSYIKGGQSVIIKARKVA